jgi:hypothetical protein
MGNCHVITNGKNFLFRFNDSAFGSKWCGLWRGEEKIIEYWAFRFGDDWLSPGKFSRFLLNQKGRHARLSYGNELSEEVVLSQRGLSVSAASKLPAPAEIEIGINLRSANENVTGNPGEVISFENGTLRVRGRSGRAAEISGLEDFALVASARKTHRPGNLAESLKWDYFHEEDEDCLVVNLRRAHPDKTAGFHVELPEAAPEFPEPEKIYPTQKQLHPAILQMRSFLAGDELWAGHPYFAKFWTRDACINIPGFVRLGMRETARDLLEKIGSSQRADGCVPNFAARGDYSGADTTPLWILAVCDYCQFSGELEFQRARLLSACHFFDKTDVNGDGLSETDRGSSYDPFLHFTTWMDSIERSGRAIEVQFLWGTALKEAGKLLGEKALSEKGERIFRKAESVFWKPEWNYFVDCVGGPTQNLKSANCLFGLALGDIDPEKARPCLETIESDEFTLPWGVSTASRKNENFSGDGYHTGAVWNVLTALASLAEFRAGRAEAGWRYLKILEANFGKRCECSLDELYDGQGNPQGAPNQAWSVCLIPRILDDGLLGIVPEAKEGKIIFSPKIPKRVEKFERRGLWFNGDLLEISIERESEGKVRMDLSGLARNRAVFAAPPGTKKVWFNGREAQLGAEIIIQGKGKVAWI